LAPQNYFPGAGAAPLLPLPKTHPRSTFGPQCAALLSLTLPWLCCGNDPLRNISTLARLLLVTDHTEHRWTICFLSEVNLGIRVGDLERNSLAGLGFEPQLLLCKANTAPPGNWDGKHGSL